MTDEVIVIGNGLAGMTAAIHAAMGGAHVSIVSQLSPDRSQSVLAAGGINSALNNKGQNDTVEEHFQDTMKAGCCLADEKAVRNLTNMAPLVIEWLQSIGVVFNLTEDFKPDQRYFGGQKKKRTVYSGAAIGRQLVAGIKTQLEKYISQGNITEYTGYEFVQLICSGTRDSQKVLGCVIADIHSRETIHLAGKAVIIASGGFNGFFGKTTGSVQNTGYVTAKLFSQGVQMGNLEMIQFHPTTIETAMKKMLISEAARGEGGRLFVYRNQQKWYFMEELYPEAGNLMPRDVVSFEEYRQSELEGLGQVYLDVTHMPENVLNGKLKEIMDLCDTYLGINPQKEYIPVSPGIHYFMGGILTDFRHRTNVDGLFAAGECACIYHGANRLGGNSTMGAIVGGIIAGQEAAKRLAVMDSEKFTSDVGKLCSEPVMQRISDILNQSLPIVRNAEVLQQGFDELLTLKKDIAKGSREDVMLSFAQALIRSAEERKESRGANKRTDFPETDENYCKVTVAAMDEDGDIKIALKNTNICFD